MEERLATATYSSACCAPARRRGHAARDENGGHSSDTLRTHAARDASTPRNRMRRSRAAATSPLTSTRLKRGG